jgi:hypothetical protein
MRPRRERPRRRAAEKRDEVAPSHTIELHSIPTNQGRIVGYRIGEEQSGVMERFHNPLAAGMDGTLARSLLIWWRRLHFRNSWRINAS